MKKALMMLAAAALGVSTLSFADAAQAGVSITFSSDYPVYHAPRVYYPAPQVIYPRYPRDYYRSRRYNRHPARNVDYRRDDDRRYDDRRYDDRRYDERHRDEPRDGGYYGRVGGPRH
jgi:hypothetical protein